MNSAAPPASAGGALLLRAAVDKSAFCAYCRYQLRNLDGASMELITSRKNPLIKRLRALANDGALRRESGQTVLDGVKLLGEALAAGCRVTALLLAEGMAPPEGLPPGTEIYRAPAELVGYASPVANSPGPVFSVELPRIAAPARADTAILLEDVQDPGNVGTVIRAANAFGVDAVLLCGRCADVSSPRVVRATMGAAFRQCVLELTAAEAAETVRRWGLPLYGAALGERALDIRQLPRGGAAVAIGNEGHGLSGEMKSLCDALTLIPMAPGSESLNAAMAAVVAMWELARVRIGVT